MQRATEHISQTWIKDAKRMWLGKDRAIECFIYYSSIPLSVFVLCLVPELGNGKLPLQNVSASLLLSGKEYPSTSYKLSVLAVVTWLL